MIVRSVRIFVVELLFGHNAMTVHHLLLLSGVFVHVHHSGVIVCHVEDDRVRDVWKRGEQGNADERDGTAFDIDSIAISDSRRLPGYLPAAVELTTVLTALG